jgi:RimJ/RimL family protein N-acetyltransferase
MDPWIHGFSVLHRGSGALIGTGGFKGPPAGGIVEIAYGVVANERGKGYATEITGALVAYAFASNEVELVRAHTLPDASASQRVLLKCGFSHVGETLDPDDGLVWRFERRRAHRGLA